MHAKIEAAHKRLMGSESWRDWTCDLDESDSLYGLASDPVTSPEDRNSAGALMLCAWIGRGHNPPIFSAVLTPASDAMLLGYLLAVTSFKMQTYDDATDIALAQRALEEYTAARFDRKFKHDNGFRSSEAHRMPYSPPEYR